MTYSPNVPSLSVTGDLQLEDIRKVYLAEFAEGAPVREVLMDPASAATPQTPSADLPAPEGFEKAPIAEAVEEAVVAIVEEAQANMTPEELLASESFPTKPVAAASGLRLHRVVAPDHSVVTQYDANRDCTPLDFLGETGAVVAVAQPGREYSWKLIQFGPASKDGNVAPILAMRPADEAETSALNEMYPGWLEAVRRFDEEAAAQTAVAPEPIVMPPPSLVQ